MDSTPYVLDPIDSLACETLRQRGAQRQIADQSPGYPCRQCLRDAEIGEAMVLYSFDPFGDDVESEYRSASPIYLHQEPCSPYAGQLAARDLPLLNVRQLSVRTFDREAKMTDATVLDGPQLDASLRRSFDDDATGFVHVHSASSGCWITAVKRSTS